jgi:hypothetical protein
VSYSTVYIVHRFVNLSILGFQDKLVAQAKSNSISAAVVFLPERTPAYGKHGSDKCYCVEMYGKTAVWG